MTDAPIAACIDCGHPHSPNLGWICIGCPCETTPIGHVVVDDGVAAVKDEASPYYILGRIKALVMTDAPFDILSDADRVERIRQVFAECLGGDDDCR